MKKLWDALRDLKFGFLEKYGRTYVTKHSKTPSKRVGYFDAFGERFRVTINVNKEGELEYTHAELSKMAVACVACGKPIWPYDPVGFLIPEEGHQIPEGAYYYESAEAYLGCFRWECEHPFRNGFWMPLQENPLQCGVMPVASEIDMMMANGGEDPVIISNTHDIGEAAKQTEALLKNHKQ